MTLAITTNQNQYTGNGSTGTYSFTMPTINTTDLVVTVLDTNNATFTLVLNTDYSVSGPNGGQAVTGSITIINAGQSWQTGGNLNSGDIITITRTVALTQSTSLRNQGTYFPEVLEAAFDYLTMICQQLNVTSNSTAAAQAAASSATASASSASTSATGAAASATAAAASATLAATYLSQVTAQAVSMALNFLGV